MLFILPLLLFCFAAAATASTPPEAGAKPNLCKSLRPRVEWRSLDSRQKVAYTEAIRCLQRLPTQNTTSPQAATRFDELQAIHITLADGIHSVGHFLPWHRAFTLIHETMLRDECQYKGPIPYWDWSRDADKLTHMRDSPVFDAHHGFGGDGVPGTYSLPDNYDTLVPSIVPINPLAFKGCVQDGPFASYKLPLGPGRLITKHCLVRNINDTYKEYLTSEAVHNATKLPNYELFRIQLEGRPVTLSPRMHDAGHVLIGGDMSNFYSSVGDPLFFLHHTNLDRIWWKWQQMDPVKRLYQITGRSTVAPPYRNVTLDFSLDFGNFSRSMLIRDVMDIHAKPLCYTYV